MSYPGASEKYAGLFYDKGAAALNVMHPDFGAVGDGDADDYGAIQGAIGAVPPEGGVVLLPPRTFIIGGGLELPEDRPIVLLGYGGYAQDGASGYGGTVLKRKAGYTGTLVRQAYAGATPTHGAALHGITLDGSGLAGDLLKLDRTNHARLVDVNFHNCLGDGLNAIMLWNATLHRCRFFNCGKADNDKYSIRLDSSAVGSTDTVFLTDCHFEAGLGTFLWAGNSNGGILRCANFSILGGKFEQSGNALGVPLMVLSDVLNCKVMSRFSNGGDNDAIHVVVETGYHVDLDTQHVTNTAVDASNPRYFVDIQGGDQIKVAGSYYRGGGDGGAQIRTANTTNVSIDPTNSYDAPVSGVAVHFNGWDLIRAGAGYTGLQMVSAATIGNGSTLPSTGQGVTTVRFDGGGTGTILAVGKKGDRLSIVNEGVGILRWDTDDAVSNVQDGVDNAILPKQAAAFLWSSGLSRWVRESSKTFRQTIDGWYQEDVAANQTDVALSRLATTTEAPTRWIALRAGWVTGVAVKTNDPRTAGTATVKVFKNGSALGSLTAILNGSNATSKATTQARGVDIFAAGDELELRITTDGTWAPTTGDIRAALEIES